MTKQILVDAVYKDEIRVVSIENDKITQLEQESSITKRVKGNIYLATISKIEPSLQAVFIDYGNSKKGFLSFSDIIPHYYQINSYDKESILNCSTEELLRRYNIQDVLSEGQELLLQVTKEERGNKGVSFTTYISIPGKYCILFPYSNNKGISKKIHDTHERKRLMEILNDIELSTGGIILRRSAIGKNDKHISNEYKNLSALWNNIQDDFAKSTAPDLISEHNDIIQKILYDLSDDTVEYITIDGQDYYKKIKERAKNIIPYEKIPIKLHRRRVPIFEYYGVEKQIAELYDSRVTLPSGGYIVINPTEALIAIDINSGRMTNGGNIEETAFKTNLEASHEIAKQIELRGLSGLIVIDFIDMSKYKNCRSIKEAIEEAFHKFNSYAQITEISEFGLMEISKQRTKKSILESTTSPCSQCLGSGYLQSYEHIFLKILRAIYNINKNCSIQLQTTQGTALYILNIQYQRILNIQEELNIKLVIGIDSALKNESFSVQKIKTSRDYADIKKNETTKSNSWIRNWLNRII